MTHKPSARWWAVLQLSRGVMLPTKRKLDGRKRILVAYMDSPNITSQQSPAIKNRIACLYPASAWTASRFGP